MSAHSKTRHCQIWLALPAGKHDKEKMNPSVRSSRQRDSFSHVFAIIVFFLFNINSRAQSTNPPVAAKALPGFKSEALWDGRKMMPFKALDFPKMVKAAAADFLVDDDYVLGVTVGAESRAYPTRFIWFHHVVNDKVADPATGHDVFYAVTYCSVCNTGIRYDSLLNGKPVMLDFYGLYNGVVSLCERETASVFLQASGEFATGPLAGTELKTGALLDTTWAQWKKLHPDTLVMSPDTPFSKFYNPKDKPEPRGYTNFPAPFFRPSVTRGDLRLPPFDKVLGVTLNPPGENSTTSAALRRAYPMKTLRDAGGVVNDTLGDVPVAVLFDSETAAANALCRRLEGRTLTLTVRDGAFYDEQTGTRWSLEGLGEQGPLAGKTLSRMDNHLSQWYGWAAYFPDTSIYGRTDPPQPGNPFASAEAAKP
jgi:hypothetical protein